MSRILAIDHGTVRMGIALSDELKMIAQPLEYIPAEPLENFWESLGKIVLEKEVEMILVGMPRNMNGTYGPASEKVRAFIAALQERLPDMLVRTWDERLTSSEANRLLIQGDVRRNQRKEKVDKMAAAILLQSYLDAIG